MFQLATSLGSGKRPRSGIYLFETIMSGLRKLPPFEQSLGATILMAREAVLAPLRPVLREHNITEPQWRVMRVINERGAADATGLAEVGLLHAPSVTRILKELEERGLVVREPDSNDRRRMLIALSEEGRELVKSTARPMVRILREYSDRFGAERLERLANELRALSAVIKGVE
jgi:homoprotocatechuate degradation regulator HpaR